MRFFLQTLITALVCFVLQYFLPWWSMALGAFAVGFIFTNTPSKSFSAGFFAVGLLWLGMSLYIDVSTGSILTQKVAQLFPINLFLLTTLIGGLTGGLASLTGSLLKP